MRHARCSALVVAVGLVVACAGAGERAETPTTPAIDTSAPATEESATPSTVVQVSGGEPLWGEEALAYVDALEAAAENGLEHLAPFIASDLVWEDRIGQELVQGADNWFDARLERELFGLFLPRGDAAYLVSADGVLREQTLDYGRMPFSTLDLLEIGPDGLEHWIGSASVDAGRWYESWRLDFDRYDGVADRYLALWSGSAAGDVASMYDEDAVVADTLLGEVVSGREAIGRSIASGACPDVARAGPFVMRGSRRSRRVVHTCDLAMPTGQPSAWDDAVVTAALAARDVLPAENRRASSRGPEPGGDKRLWQGFDRTVTTESWIVDHLQ